MEDEVFSELGTEPDYQKPVGSEVITGFDVVGLFPSIEKDLAVRICKEVLMETEVKLMDTNLLEATRFLALTMDKKEVEKSPLRKYLPRRRKVEGKKTGKLGLTTANSLAPGVNDMTQWVWKDIEMDSQVEKEIIAEALARMVGIFCETQTYNF